MAKAYTYGVDSEKLVAKFYSDEGFHLVEERKKTPYGEIDLILKNTKTLLFVEVKARNNPKHLELLSGRQFKRCLQAAQYYIDSLDENFELDSRFDYVIVVNGKVESVHKNISL